MTRGSGWLPAADMRRDFEYLMSDQKKLDLVILWHMHQPDFRDHASGEFAQPWVYLHAIKDYSDMAAHLEAHPGMRVVLNFTPVLLDQLEDYTDQFATGRFRDPLLRLLAQPDLQQLDQAGRDLVLKSCFRANQQKLIDPYPAYKRLLDFFRIAQSHGDTGVDLPVGAVSRRSVVLVSHLMDGRDGAPSRRHCAQADRQGARLFARRPLAVARRSSAGKCATSFRATANCSKRAASN